MTCYHSLMRQPQSCGKDIVTFLLWKQLWHKSEKHLGKGVPGNKPDLTQTRLDLTSVQMIVPSGTCARLSSVTIHLESLKCRGVTQASDLYAEFSSPEQKCQNNSCCAASADSVKVDKVQKKLHQIIKLNIFNQRPIGNRLLHSRRPWSKRRLFHAWGPWLGYMCPKTVLATRTSFHWKKEATVTTACA